MLYGSISRDVLTRSMLINRSRIALSVKIKRREGHVYEKNSCTQTKSRPDHGTKKCLFFFFRSFYVAGTKPNEEFYQVPERYNYKKKKKMCLHFVIRVPMAYEHKTNRIGREKLVKKKK